MTILERTASLAACLISVACAGPSPGATDLGASVPWEAPRARTRGGGTTQPAVAQSTPVESTPVESTPAMSAATDTAATDTAATDTAATDTAAMMSAVGQPEIEIIPHGVQPIERGGGDVVLLSMFELVNRGSEEAPVPPIDVVAALVGTDAESGCEPSVVSSERALGAGERRMVWVRTRCPVGQDPRVVRVTAFVEGDDRSGDDVGEAIVSGGIDPAATAAR